MDAFKNYSCDCTLSCNPDGRCFYSNASDGWASIESMGLKELEQVFMNSGLQLDKETVLTLGANAMLPPSKT